MKKILILGCTGSIGTSALNIVRNNPDLFQIVGLSAHTQEKELVTIAKEFQTKHIAITGREKTSHDTQYYYGKEGLKKLIHNSDADIVLNGISGAEGLIPSIETLLSKKNLALANKETIVMAGSLIQELAEKQGCKIIPVDSEHSAIFTLIEKHGKESLDSIILTASGGPFKNFTNEQLQTVRVQDALKHPTWNMGKKITIDSSTLANKGLEVIEACKLFNVESNKVTVSIHPQSLVHSMIRTKDGVLYAQISQPDMRYPIFSALTWPETSIAFFEPLDFSQSYEMTFSPPRFNDFPMLSLAYKSVDNGGMYTIAYNSANEIAVDAFINGIIGFTDIASITHDVLSKDWSTKAVNFEEVFETDKKARIIAQELINRRTT